MTALYESLVVNTDDFCFLEHPKEIVQSFTVGETVFSRRGCASRLMYRSECSRDLLIGEWS